jgi:hypothetical protein
LQDVADKTRLGAVALAQVRGHAARGDDGLRVVACGAQQIGRFRAAPGAFADHLLRGVDGLFGHMARRGELAANDRHQAVAGHVDFVIALDFQRLAARGRHQRPASRDAADHVLGLQVGLQRRPCAVQQEIEFLPRAHDVVEIAVVVFVSGAEVRHIAPARDGGAAAAARHRDRDRAVVADLEPRDGNVHALGRPDVQRLLFVLAAPGPVAQPYAGGHDHRAGAHADLAAVGMDDRAVHLAMRVARDVRDARVIGDSGAVKCGGARDVQRQPRIVHACVEIEKAALQMFLVEGGAVRQHFGLGQLLVQDAFAPAAGQVVGPEQAFEGFGQTLVEHAVALQHRKQEGQTLHQMPRVAAQALAFQQGMAYQAQVALFDIAQAAMHHLRRLGRRARCEVALFDQRHAIAAQAGVQCGVGAGHAAAHDQDVERVGAQAVELFAPHQPQRIGAGHGGALAVCAAGWQDHHVACFSRWVNARQTPARG